MAVDVEGLRLMSQTMHQDLRPFEAKVLFDEIARLRRERTAAAQMGLVMTRHLQERDDFVGRLAQKFRERFGDVLLPPKSLLRDETPDSRYAEVRPTNGPEAVRYLAEDFGRVVHVSTGQDTWEEFRFFRHDDGKVCFQTRTWWHTDWHDWDGLYGDNFTPGPYASTPFVVTANKNRED